MKWKLLDILAKLFDRKKRTTGFIKFPYYSFELTEEQKKFLRDKQDEGIE